jgi:hypothetical protein
MVRYHCYLIGPDHTVCSAEDISAETLGEALATARLLSSKSPYPAFELWDDAALIHRGVRQKTDPDD